MTRRVRFGDEWIEATETVDDPVRDLFGAPSVAYEFDSTDLTGLTAIGSPTVDAAHSVVPGHYVVKAAAGQKVVGRYRASPTIPFTAICKVSSALPLTPTNYNRLGWLFVGEATPGALVGVGITTDGGWLYGGTYWSNPTTPTANVGTVATVTPFFPIYLGIRVNTGDSVDLFISFDGRLWYQRAAAYDPPFTIGSVGFGQAQQSAALMAAIDYLRLFDGAKTFQTV